MKHIGRVLIIVFFLTQIVEAKIRFMPREQLVATAEYIVLAKVQDVSDSGETKQWRSVSARVINNKLLIIESIKGSLLPSNSFNLNTLKYNEWMEDNVELPSKGSKVFLFLKKSEKGELKPVNGIQGVWPMYDEKLTGVGHGTTLEQIREMVQKEVNTCKSEAFTSLVDTAEIQTEAGYYKEALEAYRKAYGICPMKDLEEQMAWLMGEVGDEDENKSFNIRSYQ